MTRTLDVDEDGYWTMGVARSLSDATLAQHSGQTRRGSFQPCPLFWVEIDNLLFVAVLSTDAQRVVRAWNSRGD